jgi:hypothetical protein
MANLPLDIAAAMLNAAFGPIRRAAEGAPRPAWLSTSS